MPEGTEIDGTTSLTVDQAASLFERMDSSEDENPDADATQNDVDGDDSEHVTDDEVVEGDDAPDADDEEEKDDAEPEIRTLKVNLPEGEQDLPEDEVVKGYLRQADYTRKTQKLAEDSKAFEGEREAVRGERQQYAEALKQLNEALKRQTPQEPDWDKLRQENPEEFAATWADWQRHQQNVAKLEAAQKEAVAKVTKDQIDAITKHVEGERAKLVDAIPAWKDEAVAKKEKDAIYNYAKQSGFTEAELDGVVDHRAMVTLRKAYLYDQLQQKKPVVQQKIATVKAATPGPADAARKKPMPERTKAKLRLARSGSVRDAAALFEQMD